MHNPATPVRPALAFAGALFGVAPAAAKLVTRVSDPIPYRIALPEGAERESRRILTNIIMGSDALLFALLDEEFRRRTLELKDVVRRIGSLGGQRAACVRSRTKNAARNGGWTSTPP